MNTYENEYYNKEKESHEAFERFCRIIFKATIICCY
jgi:hypothetical protein